MSTVGDIMSTPGAYMMSMGYIVSVLREVQYIGGIS